MEQTPIEESWYPNRKGGKWGTVVRIYDDRTERQDVHGYNTIGTRLIGDLREKRVDTVSEESKKDVRDRLVSEGGKLHPSWDGQFRYKIFDGDGNVVLIELETEEGENTNSNAIDFEEWAAPVVEDGMSRWLVRRLAVKAYHELDGTRPVTF
jgi:hypothetical protein